MYARNESTDGFENLADADLVRRFKAGNDAAFEELLRRHSESLYRFCRHLTGDPHEAEDICQETVTRALTRVDTLHSGSAFRSWLFSIARNLSIDAHRARKRTCPMPDDEAVLLPLQKEPPHDEIETLEEHQTVAQALKRLANSHQRVLVLREVDGLSYTDIAEKMNVSHSAVETLLFRARRRLREEYRKVGLPALAMGNGVRSLMSRLAAPAAGPAAVKAGVTAAVVGTAVVAAPHVPPIHHLLAPHTRPARIPGPALSTPRRRVSERATITHSIAPEQVSHTVTRAPARTAPAPIKNSHREAVQARAVRHPTHHVRHIRSSNGAAAARPGVSRPARHVVVMGPASTSSHSPWAATPSRRSHPGLAARSHPTHTSNRANPAVGAAPGPSSTVSRSAHRPHNQTSVRRWQQGNDVPRSHGRTTVERQAGRPTTTVRGVPAASGSSRQPRESQGRGHGQNATSTSAGPTAAQPVSAPTTGASGSATTPSGPASSGTGPGKSAQAPARGGSKP